MSRILRAFHLGLVALFMLVQIAVAADKGVTPKKGLDPEQVQAIQTIGQSVLMAKRTAPVNPDMIQLRQHVETLRQEVSKLNGHMPMATIDLAAITTSDAAPAATAPNPEGERMRRDRDQAETNVRNVLVKVRTHRAATQQRLEGKAVEERHQRDRRALAKVQELEDELEMALTGPANERDAKLRALESRLEIKPHAPVAQDKDKTPTISTIVHHR